MDHHGTAGAVSRRMSLQARRDTGAELALRRALHRSGLRYRVDWPLPGMPRRRADVAFTRQQVAVFVDGCFWHGCAVHKNVPATNTAWWRAKLEGNVSRDRDTDARLREQGWTVLRFWEHDDPDSAAAAVFEVVSSRAGGPRRPADADGVHGSVAD